MDFGGLVPRRIVRDAILAFMSYPQATVNLLKKGEAGRFDEPRFNVPRKQKVKGRQGYSKGRRLNDKARKELAREDCLIAEFKGRTLEEQRSFFEKEMKAMAREDDDEKHGWTYKGKTRAVGVSPGEQLRVHERTVTWSPVKQLRSVVETNFSCDELFNFLWTDQGSAVSLERVELQYRLQDKSKLTEVSFAPVRRCIALLPARVEQQDRFATKYDERVANVNVVQGDRVYPFKELKEDSAICLLHRKLPFPWPVSPSHPRESRLKSRNSRNSKVPTTRCVHRSRLLSHSLDWPFNHDVRLLQP